MNNIARPAGTEEWTGQPSKQPSTSLLSGLSIRHRLPLLMAVLLLGVIVASTWASYRGVKESALEVGRERLLNLTQQLSSLSQQSTDKLMTKTSTTANDPAVRAFLRSPSPDTRAAMEAVLKEFTAPRDPSSLQVELWSADNSLLVTLPDGSAPQLSSLDTEFKQCAAEPFKVAGTIRPIKDTVAFPAVAAVRDEAAKPIAYLVRWRKLSSTPEARKQLTDLLGSQAALYFGNSKGDVWTDLVKVVPKPPVSLPSTVEMANYTREGNSVMAVGRPISGTPWFVIVEFPDQVFLIQAGRFLRRMIVIGFVLFVIGVAGAFALSRNITQPLRSLTQAASAIGGGDYSQPVNIPRNDELGALARAFNELEARVREKTDELRAQHEFLRAVVDTSPHPIFVKDGEGRFTLVNKAVEDAYGRSAAEIIGRTEADLNGKREEVETFVKADREVIEGLTPTFIPEEQLTNSKTGETRSFQTIKVPLKLPGSGTVQVLGVATDITEQKEAAQTLKETEEQLRQSQKLEAVGQLAGGIAHDFNNLLTVIGGYSNLLLRAKNLDQPAREKMEEVKKAAERASSLTRQLLAFSRKQVLKPEVLDLNALVDGLGKMLRRLIGEDIEVITALKSDIGKINADPGQIEQVITNLVVNARDAMPNGGKITIETANVELDNAYSGMHIAVNSGSYVMLAVSDTGSGMDAKTRKHIFEPFFTTKEMGRGTGLGLSTIYGIVKQSGGNIWVYSEPANGTTFKIYLPRMDAEQTETATNGKYHQESLAPASETILLVEDEEMVRNLACNILQSTGYQVLVAKDGEEAIGICKTHAGDIDLMLTDVIMPQMNGKKVAEAVKPFRQEMAVLYMSGYTDDAIIHHGVLEPGTNFIEKPFTPEALTSKVRQTLLSG